MRQIVATIDTVESGTSSIDEQEETLDEFRFCIEGFDHTQATERLVYLRQNLSVLLLSFGGSSFERSTYATNEKTSYRQEHQHKERELPRDGEERDEIDKNHDRVFEQHIQGGHDTRLYLVDIVGHTRHHIAFALFGKEADRQTHHFPI